MKKIIPLLIFVFLASCSKENCDCGIVEGSRVDFPDGTLESQVFYLDIRNDCTGNIREDVSVTERIYDDFGISLGERICNYYSSSNYY